VLLAEAMVVIAWAGNWRVSWWEWHVLVFTSFLLIAFLAARAALLLQRVARRTATDHSDWPQFRVGVSSGEVHAGVVGAATGHRKHGIVGDVVNLAARLQAAAPVGAVLIGEDTLRALGSRAIVEPVPPMAVKGKRDAVRSYVLLGLKRGAQGGSVHFEG
jgi:adenylate cyclase